MNYDLSSISHGEALYYDEYSFIQNESLYDPQKLVCRVRTNWIPEWVFAIYIVLSSSGTGSGMENYGFEYNVSEKIEDKSTPRWNFSTDYSTDSKDLFDTFVLCRIVRDVRADGTLNGWNIFQLNIPHKIRGESIAHYIYNLEKETIKLEICKKAETEAKDTSYTIPHLYEASSTQPDRALKQG